MTSLRAHFDGKVIVPDEQTSLPVDRPLRVHVVDESVLHTQPTQTLAELRTWMDNNPPDPEAARELEEIVRSEFNRVDPSEW